MIRSVRATAFAALTLAALSGCTGAGADLLGTALKATASDNPNAKASSSPAASTGGSTTTSGGGTGTVVPATSKEACDREKADSDKDNGTAKLGAYDNQWLPKGWVAAYNSESEVTEAIHKNISDADWPCFQKFYPGASTVYLRSHSR